MKNIWTVCRRELYSYFVSPIAWVSLAIFAVLSGYFTFAAGYQFSQVSLSGEGGPMNINEWIAPLFSNLIALFGSLLIPFIAMRLFAEENRQGTIELLITSPVHNLEIILGKWAAAVVMYSALLGVALIDCSFFFIYGKPDWKPVATGFLGLLLLGACLLAICTFLSSLTRHQFVAGIVGLGLVLLLWVLNWNTAFGNSEFIQFISYLCVVTHLDGFCRGVIDTKDAIFYLSLTFLGLFLTARSLESLRWRA